MRKRWLFFFFFCVASGVFAQETGFRHYTGSQGLANSTVYYAMQDSKGYMWFCTESGVNRFDGRHFETFTTRDGLADTENFKSFEDSKGRIWFMSYNGRLSYYCDSGFVNESRDPSLKYTARQGKYIIDMMEDREGRIWFSTFLQCPCIYDGDKVTKSIYKENPKNLQNLLLYSNRGKAQVLEFLGNSAYSVDLATGKKAVVCSYINSSCVGHISKQTIGADLYFTTLSGLMVLRNGYARYLLSNQELGHLIGNFKFIGNDLWISTPDGLVLIPDFTTKGYTGHKKIFLKNIAIASILPDHEHGIWITTMSDGVYYIPASQSYMTSFPGVSFTSVSHQHKSQLWAAGTYYGDLMIWQNDTVIQRYHFKGKPAARVKGLKWLSENRILVGTDIAPFIYDMTIGTINPLSDSLIPKTHGGFNGMSESGNGLWMATRNAVWFWDYHNPPLHIFGSSFISINMFPVIVSIAAAGEQGCWFAFIQELFWLDRATAKAVALAGRELFGANLKDLKYINGYLWVATDGNGIFIFKDRRLYKHLSSKTTSITSDICHKLYYDGKDNMWVTTNKGVSVYNIHSYAHVMSLSSNDVLISDDVKDIDLYANKAYIAASSGISVIDVSKFADTASPPKLYIKTLSVGRKNYNALSVPRFRYVNGIIVLSYGAITFQANPSLSFRYKIKGQDDGWNETGSDRLEFYNLAPGLYTIQISAKKYNSRWSQPVEYTFTILPLWYQHWLFKLLAGLTAAALIYWWLRRIRKREEEKTRYHQRIAELKNSALASQMNPHFIFNAINSIQDFIFRNDELAANEYLSKFARLMRLFLESSKKAFTSVKEEMELLQLYTDLEKLRFGEKLQVNILAYEDLNPHAEIPSMLIQPFVENAINHGLIYKKEAGCLLVEFMARGSGVMCVVEDNGIGIEKSLSLKKNRHISRGMDLVNQRMETYSDLENQALYTYRIFDKTDAQGLAAGTRVEILLNV